MLPREKFFESGIDSLTDAELIGAIISSGIKGRDFREISKEIIRALKIILKDRDTEISYDALLGIQGLGIGKILKILAGIELGRRLYDLHSKKDRLVSTEQAYDLFKDMRTLKQEHLRCAFLNARFEKLAVETICIGGVNRASLLPRDIIVPALRVNAVAIILAHNHPSGDPQPSQSDVLLNQRILDSLQLVGITLLDHIIIGENNWAVIARDSALGIEKKRNL